ncbi:MAG TPA: HIT domain-containing protein, partial [Alphaproteobacteria bacterium]|nr:HIT domain-containing protein [Alphaproteobacteria bacterium]
FFLADGQSAGQEVMHLHLHVIPRLEGDGIRFQRLPGSQRTRCLPGERSRIGALIAGHLDKESG